MDWRLSLEEYLHRYGGGAERQSRLHRWSAPCAARVVNEKYGTVVVPHRSNLAALHCAAEVWHCDWFELMDSGVWLAGPEEPVAEMPESERRTAG